MIPFSVVFVRTCSSRKLASHLGIPSLASQGAEAQFRRAQSPILENPWSGFREIWSTPAIFPRNRFQGILKLDPRGASEGQARSSSFPSRRWLDDPTRLQTQKYEKGLLRLPPLAVAAYTSPKRTASKCRQSSTSSITSPPILARDVAFSGSLHLS